MLEKSVLDKPEILRRESTIEPVKKGKSWIFKLILILILIGLIYYVFTHPEIIMDPINNLFAKLK